MAKTIFITGASSGIGAVTARRAADAGWNVALFARSEDKIETLAREIGSHALAVPGDVTSLSSLEGAVAKAARHFGGLDAAFANAGTGLSKSGTEEGDPDEIARMMDINVMGVVWTARATLPELRKTRGTLVMTGSAAGRITLSGSLYGASKWFVRGYAENMAEEMREWGGRCTLIAPGMVDTPFFEDGKPDKLQPEDIADAVLHAVTADPRAAVREIYLMPQT